ncbi:MAG: cytochrome c-type biogenesis protein CcmH [Chloroflexi bacterium]|nr:cytochrome c-type biogenesis protein CcmH [Chloroflexota bacterium]
MKLERKLFWLGLVVAFAMGLTALASLTAAPAHAQGPNIDDEVNRIAKNLYCPVCPNTPLDVCSTQACAQWRALIKEKLQQGQTEQQIRDYFVAQYGQVVLGAPPPQGFNWLAYILPVIGIVIGAAVAWFTVRQWLVGRSSRAAPADAPAIPEEYAERIEKDLKEY